MNDRIRRAAALGLLLGAFCAGCAKSASAPGVSVPAGCQAFLDAYFAALKSKDVAKIQDLSEAMTSSLAAAGGADMPAGMAETARQNARKMVADSLGKLYAQFGDFKSYSVAGVKETVIAAADAGAPQMLRAGTHAEVVCKAEFSKSSGLIQFNLFKEKPDSDYSIEAWRYEGRP